MDFLHFLYKILVQIKKIFLLFPFLHTLTKKASCKNILLIILSFCNDINQDTPNFGLSLVIPNMILLRERKKVTLYYVEILC